MKNENEISYVANTRKSKVAGQQRSEDMKKMDSELKTPDEVNVQEKLPNPPKPKTNPPPSVSKTKR